MPPYSLVVNRVDKRVVVRSPGVRGLQGIQGNSITLQGTLAAGAWSPPGSPAVGDLWIAGGTITGAVNAVLGDGINWNGSAWVNRGQFRGPIGPQGNAAILRGTLAGGTWAAPGSAVAGDIWMAGGTITGGVAANSGDGLSFDGLVWTNVGPLRGAVGPQGPQGNAAIPRGTIAAGVWSAPVGAVAGDIWIAGGTITGAVTAVAGDGISFNGSTWVNFGPFRGPSGSVNGTSGKGAVFNGPTSVGNSAFMSEDANGNTFTGNLNASQGSLATLARAINRGAICLSGNSGDRATVTLTGQALGTGDFTFTHPVRLPDALPTATQYLMAITEAGSSNDCAFVNLSPTSGGILVGQAKKTGETTLSGTMLSSSAFTALLGQVVDITIRRVGNVTTFSVNGVVLVTLTGNASTVSYTAAAIVYSGNLGSGTTPYLSRMYSPAIYNRALSDAELLEFSKTGIAPADEWGTQAALYTSEFSAGVDGWTVARTTNTGNVDGILSVDDCLQITVDSTASNSHYSARAVTGLTMGKRYRITGSYYIPAANTLVTAAKILSLSVGVGNLTTTGAWTNFSFEFVAGQNTNWTVQLYNGVNATFTGNGTDAIYIKGIVLTPIGCICAPNFGQGNGSTLFDRSTNYLDAVLTGTYTHTLPSVFGEINTRVGAYIWKSISALGATYQRLFAGLVSGVFTIQSQAAGLSLVDLAINVGSGTGILIKAATGFTFANTWRVNKGSVTIAAGATYTPADTINDALEVTINSGSGTTPIALSNLTAVSGDSRVVRFSVINTTGSAVTVTTTGAVTNSSTSVAAGAKTLIVVSIIGGNAYVNVIV